MTSYAMHQRAWERDPVIIPGAHGRADVASGKRGRWGRYNDPQSLVWAENIDGKMHSLTRNQANVLDYLKAVPMGTRVTMREVADTLKVAASTVYRAMVRLAALAFIAYQSNRGRNGGSMILQRVAGDGLDWCRDLARATLRRWYKAAEARISRLRGNVASCFPGRERELYEHRYSTDTATVIGRNKYPEWTPEDFREAGLM